MQDEKPLTEQESLALITSMINKAKNDYHDTGVSALLWGSSVTICGIVSFIGAVYNKPQLFYIWYLTAVAVVVQVFIAIRESRRRKIKSYNDSGMNGIWISYGISIFLFSYYSNYFNLPHENVLFLIAYGIPTFATGISRSFKPMIIGGIACWVLAIAAIYTKHEAYTLLYSVIAAQLAWFIPGVILRRKYLKAKRGNV